nr:hypothetical protein SEVIR_1G156050v2 [Setaria viridis]
MVALFQDQSGNCALFSFDDDSYMVQTMRKKHPLSIDIQQYVLLEASLPHAILDYIMIDEYWNVDREIQHEEL